MSIAETQRIIDRYFDLMGRAADFSECCSADVTWLVADTGQVIQGAEAVRDFITRLHAQLTDMRTQRFTVGDGSVYLEGDCADPAAQVGRLHYCVAYDIRDESIVAMRCYGLGALSAT